MLGKQATGNRPPEQESASRPGAVAARPLARAAWLDAPLSTLSCVIGWLAATGVFLGLASFLGGPAEGDAPESVYSTWAIAHGDIACAVPRITTHGIASIARPSSIATPLWPLISGAFDALIRIGHNVPFPSQRALGPHCSTALAAMYKWSVQSGAALPTVRIGYLCWFVLMGGVVALLPRLGSRALPMGATCARALGVYPACSGSARGLLPPPGHRRHGVGARRRGLCAERLVGLGWRPGWTCLHISTVRSLGYRSTLCGGAQGPEDGNSPVGRSSRQLLSCSPWSRSLPDEHSELRCSVPVILRDMGERCSGRCIRMAPCS